jgi:type IV pilus assembly protein PilF
VFLCQTGKESKSIKYFEIAVSNPLFDRAELSYMRAGECLSKINDPKAEQYLKKALSINGRLRPALLRLAVIKQQSRSHLSARAYIERYFAITEPQPESLLLAYQIESSLNATDVANSYRKQLLTNFPSSVQARSLRGSGRL